MQVVLQRILEARALREERVVAECGRGLLLFTGFDREDGLEQIDWMARKIATLRVFPVGESLFGCSALDASMQVMTLSQFTLAAEVSRGRRPNFSRAAEPERAEEYYRAFGDRLAEHGLDVVQGPFRTSLVLEARHWGPFTMSLQR